MILLDCGAAAAARIFLGDDPEDERLRLNRFRFRMQTHEDSGSQYVRILLFRKQLPSDDSFDAMNNAFFADGNRSTKPSNKTWKISQW